MQTGQRKLKAPFPYFGGKSLIADLVWSRFGNVKSYVEPFAGSLAVLLARPDEPKYETVNDKDAYLANFWRALKHDPDGVAYYADWPVNEVDLLARYTWLVKTGAERVEQLKDNPYYYDIQAAGWWVWGISQWIGGGWLEKPTRPNIKKPKKGNGVHRTTNTDMYAYMNLLSERLRRVCVVCGDWTRVVTKVELFKKTPTAIFLDPPYSGDAGRNIHLYRIEDLGVAHQVREWAIEHGSDPRLRFALCGYENEHADKMPPDWICVPWKGSVGYANRNRKNDNRFKERIWFSPHCLKPTSNLNA